MLIDIKMLDADLARFSEGDVGNIVARRAGKWHAHRRNRFCASAVTTAVVYQSGGGSAPVFSLTA
ncbi:hypothetical protein DA456_01130 [Pseudomonas syringae pv. atrofaciens]|uniref:Uncharacterized protein n=1 Tax=Pseudomonas syringae pv. atrofaciens TaxID=192087 RepID=A0AAD0I4Q7_PSESX|nr:hypothetical protein [Pseudomonas syringae]AVX22106.1 hypothetical protein DA456_01130 [Pseudomonas syringae pv. atrofaciens]